MQISPELSRLVDDLHRHHPRFRRATIERLVLRMAHSVDWANGAISLAQVRDGAAEQLTYLDQGDLWGPVSANG